MFHIVEFTPSQANVRIDHLAELLIDAVEGGASIGFLPSLDYTGACEYWETVIAAMHEQTRVLIVALEGDLLQGASR